MCGIVGYNGKMKASEVLLDGLSKLEYRGYDSAGVAIRVDNDIKVIKEKGRLVNLVKEVNDSNIKGNCGIGHTRWATHGQPSKLNAHPHSSNDGSIVLVHNGIIENYQELKQKLEKKGYVFYSDTDTEVVANLIDYYYKKYHLGPIDAIAKSMVRIRGSYALAILFRDYDDNIWVARKDSPMIIGCDEDSSYVASDVPAILKYTNKVYYIDNLEMACLGKGKVTFYDLNGDIVTKELKEIKWNAKEAEKEGFKHFMIKEIYEQPEVVSKTINSMISNNDIVFRDFNLSDEDIKSITEIFIVACGSAYHVGVSAQYILEDLAKIPVRVDIASEFRYRKPIIDKDALVIIISQSGETADSLAALREVKSRNIKTLAIVNVVGSSIAREADYVMYTLAGPEIAVATTKAFSTQLVACDILAIKFGRIRGFIDDVNYKKLINEMENIPKKMNTILDSVVSDIQNLAVKFSNVHDAFFIGRGLDYAMALEGSLKLKEVSYIHSEAYAAGELKHGTISLIEDNTLVVGIVTQREVCDKTISNLVEVKSRGAYLVGICSKEMEKKDIFNNIIVIPDTISYFYPILDIIPLQLFGYYVSVAKGLDVDKPRNLAKSVTVE